MMEAAVANKFQYDVADSPHFIRNLKIAKSYDAAHVADEPPTSDEYRNVEFYMDTTAAVRIGALLLRLFFSQKFDMWFVGIFRRNGPSVAKNSDEKIKHTFMRISLWELSELLPEIHKIINQMTQQKGVKRQVIDFLSGDTHGKSERDTETFFSEKYTITSASQSFQIRPYLTSQGYCFRLRVPSLKRLSVI